MKILIYMSLMIFQSSMGPRKSKCDVPSGTTQRWVCLCDFYCVNDNAATNLENAQIMQCTLCHKNPVITTNLGTQTRKGLIFYYKKIEYLCFKTCECIS